MATIASSAPGPRRFPMWAKIVLGMLVFLIVLALALPYFLNVDRYRDTIASAIEAKTGRHVTLGKIRAKFLPGVGFVVEDLHIGSPPGFPAGDVVSADAIRGNVAISPLMHSTVHLNSLELVHPKLTLVSDNNGKISYMFTSTTAAKNPPSNVQTGAKGGEASSGMSLDEIDSILLTDAEVSMETIVKGKVEPSANVKVDLLVPGLMKIDHSKALQHQDVFRAFSLLRSHSLAAVGIAHSWLQGYDADEEARNTLGLLRPPPAPVDLVRGMSWVMSLAGPTMIAVDQIDGVINSGSVTIRSEDFSETKSFAYLLAAGLLQLFDVASRSQTVITCLYESWKSWRLVDCMLRGVIERRHDLVS